MMNIVIVGKTGQLPVELRRSLALLGSIHVIGRPEFDLSQTESLRETIRRLCPAILVNGAAYTAVDQAESEPELAMRVNAEAPGIMAEEAKRLGALFITYSSDYVFDGTKTGPYCESDEPNPLNADGASKLALDLAVQAVEGAHI
jgi:dTDP-4-dehydrorhamnose reductase